MEKEKIEFHDFMDSFIAICYIEGYVVLNIDLLNDYLQSVYGNGCNIAILGEYIHKGILSKIDGYNYLMKINDNLPLNTLLANKLNYLKDIMKHVSNYNRLCFSGHQKVINQFDDNIDIMLSGLDNFKSSK